LLHLVTLASACEQQQQQHCYGTVSSCFDGSAARPATDAKLHEKQQALLQWRRTFAIILIIIMDQPYLVFISFPIGKWHGIQDALPDLLVHAEY